MPPRNAVLLLFFFLLLAATIAAATTAAAQPPPPPPPPPHHHIRPLLASPQAPPPPPPAPPARHPHRHRHTSPPPNLPIPQQAPAPPVAAVPPPPPQVPPPPPNLPIPQQGPSYTSDSSSHEPYPFTNYPFFPAADAPPPPPSPAASSSSSPGTFPANISNLVTPTHSARRVPVVQALLISLLSLCLVVLTALLSMHLRRRRRRSANNANSSSSSSSASAAAAVRTKNNNNNDDDDDDASESEGRSLKPPPMPTSSTNPSTEFLYLATPPTTSNGSASPELRPLPPLPRVGPPSGEFASRGSSAADASSSSLSPSSPSASSPTLGSSPVHVRLRPPAIPQPRGRAPPKRSPSPPAAAHAWNPVPPPRSVAFASSDHHEEKGGKSRPLHSDKLNPESLHMKDEVIQQYLSSGVQRQVCLLGAPRCHGIGLIVGQLGVSNDQVRDALLEGNAHGLGVDALRMLTQIVLTNEEELKLKYFKDDSLSKLCPVEAFVKAMLDVPFAFKRVDAMLYIATFYLEVNQLRMSYATLEAACQEMRGSRLFHKVLEAVLSFGNFMSINAGSPSSQALEPNTVLKIVDVKGADGKAALLQFVVQEILKPEGCKTNPSSTLPGDVECRRKHGLQVVSKLGSELTSTKKAASVDITRLSRTVSELGVGLGKVHDVLRLNGMVTSAESARRFHNSMSTFLRQAEEEILKIQSQESVCLSSVREMAEYFHGDAASDEAHMIRVFASVREFLAMLDRICKEAGAMDSHIVVGGANWMAAAMLHPWG